MTFSRATAPRALRRSIVWLSAASLGVGCAPARADGDALELVRAMPLPAGTKGRIDHLTLDANGTHLWVAALANDTVEVLDLASGEVARTLREPREPQGVCLVPQSGEIVVTSGEDGMCRFYGADFAVTASISGLDDADNVRYDAHDDRVWVAYGGGALAAIDPAMHKKVGDVRLSGHPESFQLETNGRRAFANVPGARHVAVIDRDRLAVVATWPVKSAEANYPMALDEEHGRLFVGCRRPARLIVIDTTSGDVVVELDCCGDADDVFYDRSRRRVYVAGGEGSVSVFEQTDADHYRASATIPTATGARTALFVPATDRFYVAVPRATDREAEVREYRVQP